VPLAGIEPTLSVPETEVLSVELQRLVWGYSIKKSCYNTPYMVSQQVKQEYSAGGCVYRLGEGKRLWLLGVHSGYHKWVLPKGLIEAGETAPVTALREVEEEMGVKAKIIGKEPIFIEKYTYQADFKEETGSRRRVATYQENPSFAKASEGQRAVVNKTVTFYLMEWVEGDPKNHDFEMEEAGWFGYEEALGKLSFEGEKAALRLAQEKV
jgi:8-oxo-dGTP pyrophosphatase MutT (NUDIX family)